MDLTTAAIIVAVRAHGENGAVARLLTPTLGLQAGYVRGGRSRALRPVLQPGNGVRARLVARIETQLPALTVELDRSRTLIGATALGSATLEWLTALVATVLSEGVPHPRLHAALDGLFEAITLGAAPARWLADVVRFELLLLGELGFGLDLGCCAATGVADDLAYVSPKSSQAVSRAAGDPYAAKLLRLPAFLGTPHGAGNIADSVGSAAGGMGSVADGFALTGYFLARDVLVARAATLLEARARLVALAARRLDDA